MPKKRPPQPQVEQKLYRANASAVPFHNSHARVKAICGAVGSGKSTVCCFELWFLFQESLIPVRALVLRESYRQLKDSTLKTWMEWFGGASTYVKQDELIRVRVENVAGETIEHEIHLRHARRVEDATQFLSTEYAAIWLEEPVPAFERDSGVIGGGLPKGVFDVCLMRQRQAGMHRLQILLSFNPPSKFHWCFKTFFAPKREDLERQSFELFRQPARENESHLPDGYYDLLEEQLDPEMVRRFVYGESVTMYPGERVFPQFFEQLHFREALQPIPKIPLVLMLDFGLTPVCLIGQVLPNTQLRIYRELQLVNSGLERLCEQLDGLLKDRFPKLKVGRCWGDPAGSTRAQTDEKTCFDVLSSHGYICQPGAVDFTSRREAVIQRATRFVGEEPAILVDRHGCPGLTEGLLGGYRYPKSVDGQLGSRPLKNQFSHPCDALQYGCTGEFEIRTGRMKGAAEEAPAWRLPHYNPLAELKRRSRGSWMTT